MNDKTEESFSDCARGECDHLSDGQRVAAREMERSQSDEIEKAAVVNKVAPADLRPCRGGCGMMVPRRNNNMGYICEPCGREKLAAIFRASEEAGLYEI